MFQKVAPALCHTLSRKGKLTVGQMNVVFFLNFRLCGTLVILCLPEKGKMSSRSEPTFESNKKTTEVYIDSRGLDGDDGAAQHV